MKVVLRSRWKYCCIYQELDTQPHECHLSSEKGAHH